MFLNVISKTPNFFKMFIIKHVLRLAVRREPQFSHSSYIIFNILFYFS